jgi:hypothetical protein
MSQQNVELVQNIYTAFARRNIAEVLALISPDIEIVQSPELPWGGAFKGHAGLQEFLGALTTHLENKALPIERYLDAGDHVVAIGRTQGLVRANGKAFDVPLAHVWEMREGKAVRFRPFIDNPTMKAVMA